MEREYKINTSVLDVLSMLSYKGLPYPGLWFAMKRRDGNTGADFDLNGDQKQLKEKSDLAAVIRKKDALGRWIFMPVVIEHNGKEYEIENAIIKITGKKTIVETQMVGRKGSVKELISVDDYEITITGPLAPRFATG